MAAELEDAIAERKRRQLGALQAERSRRNAAAAPRDRSNIVSRQFGRLANVNIPGPSESGPFTDFFGDIADTGITSAGDTPIDLLVKGGARLAEFASRPDAFQRAAQGVARGIGGIGQAIAEDPFQTLVVEPASISGEIAPNLLEVGPNIAAGKPGAALGNLRDAATATGETALLIAAPGAGTLKRQVGNQLVSKATPRTRAAERLLEADPNLAASAREAARLRAAGQPVTVADVTSRQAQSRIKGAARREGPAIDVAQDAFDPRQAEQFARVRNDLRQSFGVEGDYLDRIDVIKAQRAATAQPLYAQAYATPTKATNRISELLGRPPLKKAVNEAAELAAIKGEELAPIVAGEPINTRTLHFMRRALDDQIDVFRDKTTGKLVLNEKGRALVGLRKEFNEAIRIGNPAFKAADDIWSGDSSAASALELGRKLSTRTKEIEVRSVMRRGIKGEDRELFEVGFAQGLEESIGRSGSPGRNIANTLLSQEKQKIIRTVLGPERGEDLLNRLRVEQLMSRTKNTISPNVGSDTAENLNQNAAQTFAIVIDLMRGSTEQALSRGARAVGGKTFAKRQAAIDEQIVKLATEDPDELIRLIVERSQPRPSTSGLIVPRLQGPGAVVGVNQTENQLAQSGQQ